MATRDHSPSPRPSPQGEGETRSTLHNPSPYLVAGRLTEMPWPVPERWVPLLLLGLGLLLLTPSIWSETSVTGMDEYWLSFRTPMEMKERGDWLTPWVNGEPRLRKPPLVYWAMLLNYHCFGVNLVSARVWGVLCGAGLAICAALFSRELFQKTGLLPGLLTLATMGVAVDGRRAMLDLPSALFSTLAVLCLVKWFRTGQPSLVPAGRVESEQLDSAKAYSSPGSSAPIRLPLLCGFFLGLSFLTKGPVGFLFFGAGLVAWLAVFRPWGFLLRHWCHVLLGLAALAAVSLPWPLTMQHLWGDRFGKIIGEELAARQFGHWMPGSPLSAWSGALGLVLPWTPLMLAAIYAHFRQRDSAGRREKSFLIVWFVLAAIPFFFMRSFERYMLALVPAQIVLCAEYLDLGPNRKIIDVFQPR